MALRNETVERHEVDRAGPAPLVDVLSDPAAFRAWYDASLPRVLGYVHARCGNDLALAEEITQQTFVSAIRHHRQFRGGADSVTWLCAIARRKLVDHYRRLDREHRRQVRLVAIDGGHDQVARVDERAAVLSALTSLRGEQQLALTLRHLDGLSVREIGELLGRSAKATESLLARARDAFRKAYQGDADA
jgi:RNA polymerase sigma-70 factor (ECF subfamily)